mgnify:CR=1 FL=1
MRFLTLILSLALLSSFACQKNSQRLLLRFNTQIYNSNFPLANRLGDDVRTTTMLVGPQGVQKVATRSVDVDIPTGQFRLSLIDMNQNNLFGEVGIDLVVLSPHQQESVPINLGTANVGILRPSNIIQVDRNFFLLRNIEPTGKAIELIVWERAPLNAVVASMQARMKQIPVHNTAQEETHLSLRNESGKSTLLIVWDYQDASTGFIRELQDQQANWRKDWQVISINMMDDPEALNHFLEQTPLGFPAYMMSNQSCRVLDCHALPPYAFFLDDKGRIFQQGIKAEGLRSWLAQLTPRKPNS